MYPNVLTEIDAGVGIVTLNRPERHNALDAEMVRDLNEALAAMAANPAVRVLVLSSAGKTFSAGADLDWTGTGASQDVHDDENGGHGLAEALRRLASFAKPTVARVQGAARGGGVGLVAACDIAIATFDAAFALAEGSPSLVPDTIFPHVIGAMGERHAKRYLLTQERFSAAEAYRVGLLHEMVADEAALDDAVGQIVEDLLQGGPNTQAESKERIRLIRRQG